MPDSNFPFFFLISPTMCAGSRSLRIFKPQEEIKIKFQIASIFKRMLIVFEITTNN